MFSCLCYQGVAEWRGKYDVTKSQLSQFGSLRSDYDKLLAAYNAVIAAGSPAQADVSYHSLSWENMVD